MSATVSLSNKSVTCGMPWYWFLCRDVTHRIRKARREAGLTQEQVGARLSPPRTHVAVSDIERDKTALTVALLYQFAEMFKKDIAWFFDSDYEHAHNLDKIAWLARSFIKWYDAGTPDVGHDVPTPEDNLRGFLDMLEGKQG